MRSIVHLSDLHFGTEDAQVAAALLADIAALRAGCIVISGDLTQRARTAEFRAAREFLAQLPRPWIAVPGNHDVPLFDVARRVLAPFDRYRRFIAHELDPWLQDEEVAVLGLNTARSLTWKSGRVSSRQIELLRRRFCGLADDRFRVLVTHHPFVPRPGEPATSIDLVGRAGRALPVLDECGIDLLLAGHLHQGSAVEVQTYRPTRRRAMIAVQAATAISRRHRGEPNAFNHVTLDRQRITIAVRSWDGARFVQSRLVSYERVAQDWQPL